MYSNSSIQRYLRFMPAIIIIGIVLVVVFVWALPVFLADLDLDRQLYAGKAGVDYITVGFLNWTAFWAPLIPAAIGTAILIHPKKFLGMLPLRTRGQRAGISILFSSVVFGISYGIGFSASEFTYGMFMAQYLAGDVAFVDVLTSFNALLVPFDPATYYNINVLLTWQYLTLPVLNAILTAILFRCILEMIGARVTFGYPAEFLGRLFVVIGIIIMYFYLASPLAVYDIVERTWLYILPLTTFTFLGTGVAALIFSKVSPKRGEEEVAGATFLIAVIVVIGMIIGPCIVAAPGFFSRELNYESIVWNGKVSTQVQQTRIASDLTGFNYLGISNLTDHPTNYDIIPRVRQFDRGSSRVKLENQIDRLYETKDDTDIIVLDNREFWVAPKSFWGGADAFEAAYNRHVIYTHTSGFLAMDAHDGHVISTAEFNTIFGVDSRYPLYFGEGYRNDIILDVPGYSEVEGGTYPGAPDGTLPAGILGWWKVIGMAFDFLPLAGNENSFLRRTNIYDRVGGMLLPYMYVDPDPYLVFDKADGRIFYSVPVYISLPQLAYYNTNYKRFLGWVLVDVLDGTMTMYQSPALDVSELISFARVYVDPEIYPWIAPAGIPAWLQGQLRYPEHLYEQQLATDYEYHVQEWQTWKQRSDLFQRPSDGDLYFVIMDIGYGLEFVGVDLVQPAYGTQTLAGMYVIRQRHDSFAETRFYRIPSAKPLIGSDTAEQVFSSFPGIAQELVLVPGKAFGNVLLYSFARSLYYMIPVYSTSSTGLQELNYVGLVNGFNQSEVVWGTGPDAAAEAFNIIRERYPEEGEYRAADFELAYTYTREVEDPATASVSFTLANRIADLNWPAVNVSVNLTVYDPAATVLASGAPVAGGTNYTVDNATYGPGITYEVASWELYPSETRGKTLQVGLDIANFSTRDLKFRFLLSIQNATGVRYDVETITFARTGHPTTNITGPDSLLQFTLPASVTEPANAAIGLLASNLNVSTARDVVVNLTVFSSNVTVRAKGQEINGTVANDPRFGDQPATTFVVLNETLGPEELYGLVVTLDLDMTGETAVELVVYLELFVDGAPVGWTWLRVITWKAG